MIQCFLQMSMSAKLKFILTFLGIKKSVKVLHGRFKSFNRLSQDYALSYLAVSLGVFCGILSGALFETSFGGLSAIASSVSIRILQEKYFNGNFSCYFLYLFFLNF